MGNLSIGFAPLARTTFDIPLAESVTRAAKTMLKDAGFELVTTDDLITELSTAKEFAATLVEDPPDVLIVFRWMHRFFYGQSRKITAVVACG